MILPKDSIIPLHPLAEVELLKGIVGLRLGQLPNLSMNRHGRELFRLRKGRVLLFAVAVPLAPGHFVGRQQMAKILRIDIQSAALTGNSGQFANILIRNAKTAAFIVDESVKGDFPGWTEIPPHLQRVVNPVEMLGAGVQMGFLGDASPLWKEPFCLSHHSRAC